MGLPTDADRPSRRAGGSAAMMSTALKRLAASAAISAAITARGSAMRRDGGRAHGEGEHESDDAIGADLVIAHDGKAALFGVAGEAVGEIGKSVLVQRAGGEDHGDERAKRGERGRAGQRMSEPIDRAADGADRGTRPPDRPTPPPPARSPAAARGDAPAGA